MSLNYNFENIPRDVTFPKLSDPEEIAYFRKYARTCGRTVIDNGDDDFRIFSPKTEQLIWLTMSIGVSRITKQNWKKFFNRAYAWQRVREHDILVTAQDVYDHIGLRTNASSLTDARFRTQLMKAADGMAQRQADRVNTTKES